MSRFMAAPDNKIPSVNGDAILALTRTVEIWEQTRNGMETLTNEHVREMTKDYSDDPWLDVAKEVRALAKILENPELTPERKLKSFKKIIGNWFRYLVAFTTQGSAK